MSKEHEADRKTVLFAPLNWGLGHATRILPLLNSYEKKGWNVIVASDGNALKLIQTECPEVQTFDIQSKRLDYSKYNFLLAHLFSLVPKFLSNVRKDRLFLKQLSEKIKIDLIISDNRYGFRLDSIKSIFISHQLQLAFPNYLKPFKFLVQNKINSWINQFDSCWIMDDSKHSFAGELSSEKALKIPYQFIGLQSRMLAQNTKQDLDFLAVISGLEPQRSLFETQIISAFKNTNYKLIIVGGHFGEKPENSKIEYLPFANSETLNQLLNRTKWVISSSGYSSVMDLIQINKKAILIPTPGQVEQEYLAQWHRKNPNFIISNAETKSIQLAIHKAVSNS